MQDDNNVKAATFRFLFWLLLIPIAGCAPSASPVKPDRAKESLITALEAWKRGEPIDSTPSMTCQDKDWQEGKVLVEFELQEGEVNDGLNMHYPVRLKVKSKDGKEVVKNVTYVVGTSPVITVFREIKM